MLASIALLALSDSASAQTASAAHRQRQDWWRNCASLDLDFYNDRYYLNGNTTCDGTVGTLYSGINNFITGSGATFTRAGTNVTATGAPFYLASNQAFVSRAVNTLTYIQTGPAFYLSGSQAFVSRAASTVSYTSTAPPFYLGTGQTFTSRASTATYFNSSGVLSTATANTARSNYTYNGSAWVLAGSLIEPSATNLVIDSVFTGTTGAGHSSTGWVCTGTQSCAPNSLTAGPVLGYSTDYIAVRQVSGGGLQGFQQSVSISTNTPYTVSAYVRAPQDGSAACGPSVYWGIASTVITPLASTGALTNNWTRYSATVIFASNSTQMVSFVAPVCPTGAGFDIALPQFEAGAVATSYIPTTTTTVTRAADIYSTPFTGTYFDGTGTLQMATTSVVRDTHNFTSPYADLGNLIEPASTNSIRNNTMVGAVASTAIAAQTVSNMTASSTTVTVTTGAAHGLAVGNVVTVTGAAPSAYNGTFAVASVPNSTSFTYTAASAPGTSPASTLGAYTAMTTGTIPTNWGGVGVANGVAKVIVGTGYEYGMSYVDLRFFGTPDGTSSLSQIGFEPTVIAVSPGQTWTLSTYARLVGGSVSNCTPNIGINWATSGSVFISEVKQYFTPTSTLTRYTTSGQAPDTSALASASLKLYNLSAGSPVDLTIRVYAPQMENAATATSPILTSAATVTRNGDVYTTPFSGTYFNASGVQNTATTSVARTNYTYGGSSWVNAGTLIEPAATNLTPNGSNTTAAGALTLNAGTSPDGTQDAELFIPTTANSGHYIVQAGTTQTNGTAYAWSFYAKATGSTYGIWAGLSGTGSAYVNLSTCTLTTATTLTTASVTSVGNGWCYIAVTYTSVGNNQAIYAFNGSSLSFAGDGTSGFLLYGEQTEASSYATSYIPTTTASQSRSADVYAVPAGGSYFDGSGVMQLAKPNTPRLDHDPVTFAPKGVLIEESRTNLLTYSTDFTQSYWTRPGGITTVASSSSSGAPDGSTSVIKLKEDNSSAEHYTSVNVSGSNTGTFTFSLFAKAAEDSNIVLYMDDTTGNSLAYNFNLTTQAITQTHNGPWTSLSSQIQALSNGWYRCSITGTRAASTSLGIRISTSNGSSYDAFGLGNYTGTTGNGLYIWGAQAEQSAFPTSYIPTSGATVTRAVDSFAIPSSPWYSSTGGTMLSTWYAPLVSGINNRGVFSLGDGTNNNGTDARTNGNSNTNTAGTGVESVSQTVNGLQINKVSKSVAPNDIRVSFSGNAVSTTAAAIPAVTQLAIGDVCGGPCALDGTISRATYLPVVTPNPALQDYSR